MKPRRPREDPQRDKKRKTIEAGEEKKSEISGGPGEERSSREVVRRQPVRQRGGPGEG